MFLTLCLGGLGLLVGSFIGLVSLRLPQGRQVVAGRSACGACGRALAPWDLVPVLSYLVWRGRCRTCRATIPWRYPAIEIACAGIGVWAGLFGAGEWPLAVVTAVLGWQLLLIAVVDAENFWLPDLLTWPLAVTGLAAAAWIHSDQILARVIGAVVGFLTLQAIRLGYRALRGREGLGGGDPYLLAAIGAWVGWIGLPSVLVWASLAGLSLVAAARVTGRRMGATDRMPFGTLMAVGAWMTWLIGPLGA